MINCNPETVSTDYDTVDRLYFEPLTFEDVIVDHRRASSEAGGDVSCVVQFGGQTPLKLALPLQEAASGSSARRPTRSTSPRIASASPQLLWELRHSAGRRAARRRRAEEAREVAGEDRLPGGRAAVVRARRPRRWRSSTTSAALERYMTQRRRRLAGASDPDRQVPRGRVRARRRRGRRRDRRASSSAASWSTSRRPASTPATARASCRRTIVAERHLAHDPRLHAADRARAQGRRPDERAVRDQGRHGLRARGEPARVADGAVPVEGDRRAAGQGRGAA